MEKGVVDAPTGAAMEGAGDDVCVPGCEFCEVRCVFCSEGGVHGPEEAFGFGGAVVSSGVGIAGIVEKTAKDLEAGGGGVEWIG